MRLGKRQLHDLLFYLVLTRELESTLSRLHRERGLESPLELRSGLEALGVGAGFVLTPRDTLATSIRSLGALILRAVKPEELACQLLGKASAPSGGWDGLHELGDFSRGVVATTGHPATHVSVMAGLSFSFQFLGEERMALALVPEEAVSTGDFHEGVNFAAVRKVPLVVVVVREVVPGPASTTRVNVSQLYERAKGYGMAALPVDGGDLLQVVQVVDTAARRAKSGAGPTLVEAMVRAPRSYPTSESAVPVPFLRAFPGAPDADDSSADPLRRFESFLIEQSWLEPSEHEAIAARAAQTVAGAIERADGASAPTAGTADDERAALTAR